MNCAKPTDFTFSFTGFARRGGDTDCHEDGWGLVFYEGRGVRAFHDPLPAAKSPIAELVANYPCKTLNMISHIRYATTGACLLENVHPFQREMWGIQFAFAHNGDVPSYAGIGKEHMQDYSLMYAMADSVGDCEPMLFFVFSLLPWRIFIYLFIHLQLLIQGLEMFLQAKKHMSQSEAATVKLYFVNF